MANRYARIAALCESTIICTSQLTNYLDAALLVYDTLLTLSDEIKYIWHKKFRLGTVLYWITRYPALVLFSLEVLPICLKVSLKVRLAIDTHSN